MVDLINCDYDLTALPAASDTTATLLLFLLITVLATHNVSPWFILGLIPGWILVYWKLNVWCAIIEEWD
jgi:hypothetical protein